MPIIFCILPLATILIFHTRLCRCFHKYKLPCEVVKVFQKHYKDGTAGTPDYRLFAGFYFVSRIAYLLTLSTSTLNNFYAQWFLAFVAVLLISYLQPYKDRKFNCLDCFWFAELTAMRVSLYQYETNTGNNILNGVIISLGVLMPFIYFITLVVYVVLKTICRRLCPRISCICCRNCFKKRSLIPSQDQLPHRLLHSQEYRPLLPST